jgi:periplasmic protein TonB
VDSQPRHLTPAFAVSVIVHASVIVALLFVFSQQQEPSPAVTRLEPLTLVWIADPRPAARGGGAPARPSPPPPVPAPAVSAPPPTPVVVTEPEVIAREPDPPAVAAVAPSVSPAAAASGTPSNGVGDTPGPGVGTDKGPGGGGDQPYGIGNGVTAPIPLRRPPPAYTAEAMRARLQGVVVLNCVVRPDGKCSDIRVTKSLDMMFGLDQQAVASAREWVFRPGMRLGQPVPVLVTLEIGFTIR